jgi:hypothetical protein
MNINKKQLFTAIFLYDSNYIEQLILVGPNYVWSMDYMEKLAAQVEKDNPVFSGEYERLLIIIIFHLASLFGFKRISYLNSVKIIAVDYWRENNMKEKFPNVQVQEAICNNKVLLEFLNDIVKFTNIRFIVNNNGIINNSTELNS